MLLYIIVYVIFLAKDNLFLSFLNKIIKNLNEYTLYEQQLTAVLEQNKTNKDI